MRRKEKGAYCMDEQTKLVKHQSGNGLSLQRQLNLAFQNN
jgi:hypothetical protein